MTYEELLDALDDATEKEKVELELEILGRLLYYPGD
jgi:hypothetical protein